MKRVNFAPLTKADVGALIVMHREAFPGFFLSTLGSSFLKQFYLGFIGDPSAITVTARSPEGRVLGAAVGTTAPAGFFRRLLTRRLLGFASASVCAIVRDIRVAPRLFRAVTYRGDAPTQSEGALLSSICVAPSAQGSGLGRELLVAWTERAACAQSPFAYLTTDAEGNSSVNTFYVKSGWILHDSFTTREGRRMNRYRKVLTPGQGNQGFGGE